MKKLNLLTIIIMLAVASVSFGQSVSDAGNPHNFSGATWNTDGEICEPCHTPHNSIGPANTPLWNHGITTETFDTYSNTVSLDATMGQPNGSSKLCLSCHDGSVALDNFSGAAGSTMLTGDALIGTDLKNDHPISFTYDVSLATTDGELADPSTDISGLGGTIAADMLSGDQMECSSCHDAHNNANGSLLIKDNGASALCLTCHEK
jgi:predicted CXXCH cytochrome family protein